MIRSAAFAVLAGLCAWPAFAQPAGLTADINRAFVAAIERNKLLGSYPTRCLSIEVESDTQDALDVGVHEVHERGCLGDPATYPRVLGLRYDKQTRQVLRENIVENRYDPIR